MNTSTVTLSGPDQCPVELHTRAELTQDILWQTRLQSWQGCCIISRCCGGQNKLVVFREPETGYFSLRAYPGTRDCHHANCPAVGDPSPSAEAASSSPTFEELANRAFDFAYLRWWLSGESNTAIQPTLFSEYRKLRPTGDTFRVAIVDCDTAPTMGGRHHFEFPVTEYSDASEGVPEIWRAWAYGNHVSGRHEILGRPIRCDYLALAELDEVEGLENRFIDRVHCWPIVQTCHGLHAVQSAAEADYGAILGNDVRYLKPPSMPFLRLLAQANAELSPLAQLCVANNIWPDYLLPSGKVGQIVELLGKTDLDYLRRALEKFELYRRLAHECGLRWHAVVPARDGGFQTIAGSDDHFAGVMQ